MNDALDQHIDGILDLLENNSTSNKLIEKVKIHHNDIFKYLSNEYTSDLSEDEYNFLEYGVFLICAVLYKFNPEIKIDVEAFIEEEEKLCAQYESDKQSISRTFTQVSFKDPKVDLFNLAEEYYFTLEEEKIGPLPRNIIAIVLIALIRICVID